MSFHITTN